MMIPTLPLAFFSPWELIVIAGLGVLIFGRKLPDIGKNIGRTIVEFKKGLNAPVDDIKKSIDEAGTPEETPRITAKTSSTTVRRIASTTDEP